MGKRHIKETNPVLWNALVFIVDKYPPKLEENEYETHAKDAIINSTGGTYKSGASVADQPLDRKPSVANNIDNILDEYKSIRDFIREDFEHRRNPNTSLTIQSKTQYVFFSKKSNAGLDRVPLEKLESPPKTKNLFLLEAYTRRRAIFSLLKICIELDLKLFSSNTYFKKMLLKDSQKENSSFNKAVRIEPCLLQSKIGIEVIRSMDLWDKENIRGLGIALNPKGKNKIDSKHFTPKHTSLLQMILLVLKAIEPGVTKLKDTELIELLRINSHYPKNYDPDLFRKIRSPIFRK